MKKYCKFFFFFLISVLNVAKGLESNEELLLRMKEDPLSVEQAILASTDIRQFGEPYTSTSGSLPSDIPYLGYATFDFYGILNSERMTLFINELMCMDTLRSDLTPTVRKVASYLLDQGLDPLGHKDITFCPFQVALQRGHFDVAKKILEKIHALGPHELKVIYPEVNPFLLLAGCKHPNRILDDESNEPRDWLVELAAFYEEKWPQETQRCIDSMVEEFTASKPKFGCVGVFNLCLYVAARNENNSLIHFILARTDKVPDMLPLLINKAYRKHDENEVTFLAQLILKKGYTIDCYDQGILDSLYKVVQAGIQDYAQGGLLEEHLLVQALQGAIDHQIGYLNLYVANEEGENIFTRAAQLGHMKIAECASKYLEQYELFCQIDLRRRQENLQKCLESYDCIQEAKKCILSAIKKRIPGLDLTITNGDVLENYWGFNTVLGATSERGAVKNETLLHRAVSVADSDLIDLILQYTNEQASWVR